MTWRRSNGGAWHACMTSGWPPRSEQLDNSGHRQAACNLLVKLDQCNTGKELVAHELWVHRLAKGTARALPFWPRSSGALPCYFTCLPPQNQQLGGNAASFFHNSIKPQTHTVTRRGVKLLRSGVNQREPDFWTVWERVRPGATPEHHSERPTPTVQPGAGQGRRLWRVPQCF